MYGGPVIRELGPGHFVDLSERVAVLGRIAVADPVTAAGLAARHEVEGADAVVLDPALVDPLLTEGPDSSLLRHVAAATVLPVLEGPVDGAVEVLGSGEHQLPELVTALTAAVADGAQLVVVDDVATARRTVDVAAQVRAHGTDVDSSGTD